MKEPEPTLGTDDCEGHVFVWTCPALDSDRPRGELPVPNAEAAAGHVREPLTPGTVVHAAGSKARGGKWGKPAT